MVKTASLLHATHIPCIAHMIHNLVLTDGIKKTQGLKNLLKSCREIHQALVFKSFEFRKTQNELNDPDALLQKALRTSNNLNSDDEADEKHS